MQLEAGAASAAADARAAAAEACSLLEQQVMFLGFGVQGEAWFRYPTLSKP